tara:strand:+ start:1380 stop:2576 length:1197 start_codon:yes stop_codon:yes gene_type:complete
MPRNPNRRKPITSTSSIPTIDSDPKRLFRVLQQLGKMPQDYNSFEEVGNAFLRMIKVEGLTKNEARAKLLGSEDNFKNVVGQQYLDIDQSKDGSFRGYKKRSFREDLNPVEELILTDIYNEDYVNDFRKYLRRTWDRTSKLDIKQIDKHLETFGKAGRGRFHRGHGFAAMAGAGVSRENVTPEYGRFNVAHGSKPRFAEGIMRDLNMSANDMQAHYDRLLTMEGLDINPVRFNELYVGADESMALGDDPAVRIRPEQIEMTQQGLYDRMRQGESTESLRQEAAGKSLLLDATTATPESGPVRTVRPADIKMERGRIRFLPIVTKALTTIAGSALSPSSKMLDAAAEVAGTMLPEEIQQDPMVQQTLGIMSAPLPTQAKAALTVLQPTPLASGELKDNQ